MKFPPSTRTKDDANKELHEIDLKINTELAKLEILQRDRSEAEVGFSLREISSKKIEEDAKNDYGITIKEKVKTEEKLKEINAEINLRNRAVISQNEIISKNKIVISDLEAKKRECEKQFLITEKEKKEISAQLDSNISEKQHELQLANHNLHSANKKLVVIEEKTKETRNEIREKEKIIIQREIELEQKKSDLRTISVRLHQKYNKFINTIEKKTINI